jgi:membrane protease YdiL (CAAX protease family)
MRRPSALPIAVAAALSSLSGGLFTSASASGRPRPGQLASHEVYVKEVEAAKTAALRAVLAGYDAALAHDRNDVAVAVERCRFLDQALAATEDEDEEESSDDSRVECRAMLASRFPRQPLALLYRSEFLYGDEKSVFVQELLTDREVGWSAGQRAELHRQLAIGYSLQKKPAAANSEARLALALGRSLAPAPAPAQAQNDTLDLSRIVATELLAEGRHSEAVVALSAHSEGEPYALMEKARLLTDAGAPLRALWLYDLARRRGHAYIAPAQLAATLEKAGKLDEARAQYALVPKALNRHATLAHLFALDLARGDAAQADRSYQSLRDLGWRADPFGGYRLALARKFPSLPWRRRDLAGGLGFLLGLVACLLMPGLWVVPIHYWSLLRRRRYPLRLPPARLASCWRFGHVWLGSAALLVAQAVAGFIFSYAEMTSYFWIAAKEKLTTPMHDLGTLALCDVGGELLLLALLLRRADLGLFGPGRWTVAKSVGRATLAIGALFVIAALWALLTRSHAPGSAALSVEEMIKALRQVYGVGAVILVVVVLTPLVEELLFRSLLLDVFARYMPFAAANVLQASLFAAAHVEPRKIPYLFVVGLLCGWLRARSGGLLASVTLHALNNAFATLVALSAATPAAGPVKPPPPLGPLAPALAACMERTPAAKGFKVHKERPLAGELNDVAWTIAIDPSATPGCLQAAEDAVDSALAQDPERAAALDTEATVFYRQGRLDEAIDLGRVVIEQLGRDSDGAYAQLARFLRARQERSGPFVAGSGTPGAAQLAVVQVAGGQTFQLDLGDAFPDGVTLYFRVIAADGQTSLLRAQVGPRHERSYRLDAQTGPLQLDAATLRLQLALMDSRGCEGCAPGSWSWSMHFPDRTVEKYP